MMLNLANLRWHMAIVECQHVDKVDREITSHIGYFLLTWKVWIRKNVAILYLSKCSCKYQFANKNSAEVKRLLHQSLDNVKINRS